MNNDALATFIEQTRATFGPLTTEMVASVRAQLEQLAKAPSTERWLAALHEEAPASKELYRDGTHGFVLLAHSEPTGLYRPPHDHGRGWVIYALQRGVMEIGTYARVQDADGRVRLVKRDASPLREGEARVYLPGDIHDTRCVSGPSLLFRFTERDLKKEDQEAHRVTRYVARNGVWTVGPGMTTLYRQARERRSPVAARAPSTASVMNPPSHAPLDERNRALPRPVDDEGDTGLLGLRRTSAIACALAALVLVVLDASIANVALPAIARSLQVTPAESVRVITAYQMALVMALLPCAALGESLGYRRVYTAGVALFVGASALCAFAPSLSFLVAARFVQGLGGAAIMSLGVALLRFVVPQRQFGIAIGWNALAVALSSAAGPTVGALVLSNASWPWLFAVNLPLGALVLLATRALPHVPGTARKLDLFSVALNAAAFGALVVGAELLPDRPVLAAFLLAAGALAMLALVRRELPRQAPMIPLDLLHEGSFRISVIASVCCFVGQSAAMVSLPFYLQHGLGQDALRTGLLITPWPLTVAFVAPIAGRIANRVSGAWLCALGGALLALGLASAALWPLQGRPFWLIPFVVLCGVGFGLFQVPNNRNMFLSAPRARSGAAGGMQSTARLTGQTIGAVIMTLLFTMTSIDLAPRLGLGIAAVLTLVAGLVSMLRAPSDVRAR